MDRKITAMYYNAVSLFSLFKLSTRDTNFTLQYPAVKLDISMRNFVYSSCVKWNSLIDKILEKSVPSESGVVIRGSVQNSDLCASIPFVKKKLKNILLECQALGNEIEWGPENAF